MMLDLHCAHARFVWNLALEQANMWRRDKTLRGLHAPNNAARMRQLTEARAASDWLREGSTVVQQGALRDFDRAMTNWWGGSHKKPTWRKQGQHDGFVIRDLTVQRLSRRWGTVHVPKVGPVRFRLTRTWGQVTAATSARVTFRHGQWHVSFTTLPAPKIEARTGAVVGIDRGVANSLALSDGRMFHAPSWTAGESARFVALQRKQARQKKGSARRERTKKAIGRLHLTLSNRRTDWVEQTTTMLAREHDLIAVENLNTRGMTKRPAPKPDPGQPGVFLPNRASAKAKLNRAILASQWGRVEQRLTHKLPDGHLVKVDPRDTSRICHECGHPSVENRESQAVFVCKDCGHAAHADTNAARNILSRALEPKHVNPRTSGARTRQSRKGRVNHPEPALA